MKSKINTNETKPKESQLYIFWNISNLAAKAPGLNSGKKLSNKLSNREALNYKPTFWIFFPPKRDLCCNAMQWFLFILPEIGSQPTSSSIQ